MSLNVITVRGNEPTAYTGTWAKAPHGNALEYGVNSYLKAAEAGEILKTDEVAIQYTPKKADGAIEQQDRIAGLLGFSLAWMRANIGGPFDGDDLNLRLAKDSTFTKARVSSALPGEQVLNNLNTFPIVVLKNLQEDGVIQELGDLMASQHVGLLDVPDVANFFDVVDGAPEKLNATKNLNTLATQKINEIIYNNQLNSANLKEDGILHPDELTFIDKLLHTLDDRTVNSSVKPSLRLAFRSAIQSAEHKNNTSQVFQQMKAAAE